MEERELRASIAAVGPLLPVLIWRGRVVDGQKRDRICGELGLVVPVRVLQSPDELCAALWVVHQQRAIDEARELGADSVKEIASLCSARVAEVARLLAAANKRAPDKRSPRRSRSQKTVLMQVWAEPQLKHFALAAGATESLDLSATVRVALWEYVQRHLPAAATEGKRRGPGPEWVKPRERRRPARELR